MMINRRKYFLKFWFPVIICVMLIFWGSSLEKPLTEVIDILGVDKILHILEYAVLGFFLARAIGGPSLKASATKLVFITFVIGVFYGMSDELHQYFVPGRDMSILDLAADAAGSFLGALAFIIFIKRNKAIING